MDVGHPSGLRRQSLAACALASRGVAHLGQPDGGGPVCRVGGDSLFSGRNLTSVVTPAPWLEGVLSFLLRIYALNDRNRPEAVIE
jgi:hypothetical protein